MTSTPQPKTYDEHRHYLHQIVRLQLWFAWRWRRDHPAEPFASVLRHRVDVYRKTDINPGTMNPPRTDFDDPRWRQLEERLAALEARHAGDSGAEAFEEAAFEIVRPTVDARCRRDFEERPYVLDYQCGSLRYDPPGGASPRRVGFHIANSVRPRSIFDDPDHLPGCLLDLMDKTAALYGADTIETGTWLNSHPRWLALFPDSWRLNMGPEIDDVMWHFGFWGQFINARGGFNEALGLRMRLTGQLPYKLRTSWCTFADLRRHLENPLRSGRAADRERNTP